MKEYKIIDFDVDTRVNKVIYESMNIYLSKLETGFIEVGLEDTFKMHLADIIGKQLELLTFYDNERFIIRLELNMQIGTKKDYIDIVIEHNKENQKRLYLIELKFKKITDSAPDLGAIESYIDIQNLECQYHSNNNSNNKICGCYFIFLTDLSTYCNKPNRGTRLELPFYDKAYIKKNKKYIVTGKSAQKNCIKYPDGFKFKNNHSIKFMHSTIKGKNYWHFILKIKKIF